MAGLKKKRGPIDFCSELQPLIMFLNEHLDWEHGTD